MRNNILVNIFVKYIGTLNSVESVIITHHIYPVKTKITYNLLNNVLKKII